MAERTIIIRKATVEDFTKLYRLGLETLEFKVSSSNEFMDREEFMSIIKNPLGTLLVAEEKTDLLGFIYASRRDIERAPESTWACLVYIVVKSEYRRRGIAQKLYDACLKELKEHGITNIYVWANSESGGSIIKFMKQNGFNEGHKYVWMDKKI